METRRLGRTNLLVSAIGFGGARLDEHPDQAAATVHRALKNQVNFIDTARGYGSSEEKLGIALQGRRQEYILASKAHSETPDSTLKSLETSLSLLQVDAVDLFYAHGCDDEERYVATMRSGGALASLEKARSQGLTHHIGISFDHFLPFEKGRSGIDRMKALIQTDAFDVIQVPMSLIRIESIEEEVLPMAVARDIGVVVNFPTANGLLAQEWGVFKTIFGPYVATPYQASMLGLLLHPEVTSVLSGMSLPEMADENCEVGHIIERISDQERATLRRQVDALGVGSCRSCGRCAPFTQGVPVAQIMTYHDAAHRFGIASARHHYESYCDQVLAAKSFEGADDVCPEGFDVFAEVKKVVSNNL